jgi:hypothetical protein
MKMDNTTVSLSPANVRYAESRESSKQRIVGGGL